MVEGALEIRVPNRSQENAVDLGSPLRYVILSLRWSFKFLAEPAGLFLCLPPWKYGFA